MYVKATNVPYSSVETNSNASFLNEKTRTRANNIVSNSTKKLDNYKEEMEDDSFIEDFRPAFGNKKPINDISDDLKELLLMFTNAGINIKVTSGYREGAVQANGEPSLHASGNAVDIVPVNGNYQAIDVAIANNPQIIDYMRRTGIGIYREIDPEVMRQTGATGPHYHMGKGAGKSYLDSIKQYVKQV